MWEQGVKVLSDLFLHIIPDFINSIRYVFFQLKKKKKLNTFAFSLALQAGWQAATLANYHCFGWLSLLQGLCTSSLCACFLFTCSSFGNKWFLQKCYQLFSGLSSKGKWNFLLSQEMGIKLLRSDAIWDSSSGLLWCHMPANYWLIPNLLHSLLSGQFEAMELYASNIHSILNWGERERPGTINGQLKITLLT